MRYQQTLLKIIERRSQKTVYQHKQRMTVIFTMLQLATCVCSILAYHFLSYGMIHFNIMMFMRMAPRSAFHCNFWSTLDPRYMHKKCSIQNDKPVAFQAHLIHLLK
jgi:hypothetical protein